MTNSKKKLNCDSVKKCLADAELNQKIGVIIVNWNSWRELQLCLTAIAHQSLTFHRVLVIDNNSEMPSFSIPELDDGKVEYLSMPSNTGFAVANNFGALHLDDCEWVALINPDAYLAYDWHLRMKDALRQNPDCAAFCGPLISKANSNIFDGVGDVYHISGLVWRNLHGKKVEPLGEEIKEIFSTCAAAALYRRSSFLEIGGFDEDYFCYVEDVDLGFRLRLAGYRSMIVPGALAVHVGSATSGGKHSDFAVYHGHRNLVWTFIKNMPGVLLWLLLPLHLLMNLVVIIIFCLRNQAGVILRAKRDALMGIPKAWVKRKAIQDNRSVTVRQIWHVLDKRLFRYTTSVKRSHGTK